MSFFQQPKPRGFQHQYLYVDERKERLKEMERRAKAALGQQEEQPYDAEAQLKGTIRRSSHHAHRRKSLSVATVLLQALFVAVAMAVARATVIEQTVACNGFLSIHNGGPAIQLRLVALGVEKSIFGFHHTRLGSYLGWTQHMGN